MFVSSTYEDLKRERQAVMLALLESKCIPAGMELFPAASVKQWELIKRVIDESDYYLVLVGGRYGSIPARSEKKTSYTEREFNYAAKRGKPILGFYHGNPDKLSPKRREKTAIGQKRLDQFRAKIKNLPCRHWNSPMDLGSAVKTAIAYAIERNPQPGWVRGGSPSDSNGKPVSEAESAPSDPLLRLNSSIRTQAKKLLELIWASENQRIANSRLPELLNSPPAKAHLLRDKLCNLGLANNATNFEQSEDFWIALTDKGLDYVNDTKKKVSETRLTVACGENILPPTIARNRNAFNSLTGAVAATADLFGFSLVNSGPGIIVKCRAILTSVEKEGVILCSDSGALPFEPLNAGPDLEVVDLHPGFSQRVTVCSIQDDGSVHAGSFGMLWRHAKFPEYFNAEGDYTLKVTVSAENHDPIYLDFTLHKGKSRTESSLDLTSTSATPGS